MRYVKFNKKSADITVGQEYEIVYEDKNVFCFYDDCKDFRSASESTLSYYEAEIIDRPVIVKSKAGFEYELIKILDECPDGWNYLGKDKAGNYTLLKKEELEFKEETLTLEQRIEKLEQIINNK